MCHLAAARAHPPGQLSWLQYLQVQEVSLQRLAFMAHHFLMHKLHWLNRKMAVLLSILHQAVLFALDRGQATWHHQVHSLAGRLRGPSAMPA